jgi:transcription antitermination factor NusG
MNSLTPPAWFALTVKPRHEKAAAQNLGNLGLEQFLPLYRARRRWSDRLKVLELSLFPGYVFCRFGYDRRLQVLNVPGVISIVGFGKSPVPVADEEINAVRDILASGLQAWPWPYLQVGGKVRITRGPLTGLEGTLVREKDAWRVVVNIELLRRSVAVEIDREMIAALPVARSHAPRPAPQLLYGHSQA